MTKKKQDDAAEPTVADSAADAVAEKVEELKEVIEEAAEEKHAGPDPTIELKNKILALVDSLTVAHEQDKGRLTSSPCPSCKRDVEAQNRLGSRVPELLQELAELAK